jgi:hypothetical protein
MDIRRRHRDPAIVAGVITPWLVPLWTTRDAGQ